MGKIMYRDFEYSGMVQITETYELTVSGMSIAINRRSGIVSIDIGSISSLAAGSVQIGTLPEGWRPVATVYGDFGIPSSSSITNPIRVIVGIDGKLSIYNYGSAISSTKNYAIHIVYLVA